VLGSTAAISLLVGGIGIMNIMLASVSERTREIGIRRALGAKQADIIFQFLIETASLSLFGTAIGVIVGLAAPALVAYLSGMDTVVTLWSVVIASTVSITVGIVFGIYPARQAARLDPIEALRHS
jgi:putative ABC transport system permease protein